MQQLNEILLVTDEMAEQLASRAGLGFRAPVELIPRHGVEDAHEERGLDRTALEEEFPIGHLPTPFYITLRQDEE